MQPYSNSIDSNGSYKHDVGKTGSMSMLTSIESGQAYTTNLNFSSMWSLNHGKSVKKVLEFLLKTHGANY